jgi:ribose transport system permease protein
MLLHGVKMETTVKNHNPQNKLLTWFQSASSFFILLLVVIILSITSDKFFTLSNLSNVALQSSLVAIISIGMTMVMLTAGIDLSVGSIAALSGTICAGMMSRHGLSITFSIVIGIAVGITAGVINGGITVFGKIPPFVTTLAMLGVARGLTLVYTEGKPISGFERTFTNLGTESIGPIPIPVFIWVVLLLITFLILRYTRFGLYIYAIGGNEETARLAGIRVRMIKILVYAISGGFASLSGILLTARLWSAQPQMAVGVELDAIAAAVLGGVSLFGGVGNVIGASIGALIIGVLGNGLNLLRIPSYLQQVIKGIVFILAASLDLYSKRQNK